MTDGSVWRSKVRGYLMFEMFSVRFDSTDGEDPGNLYGTITLTDDDKKFKYLYGGKIVAYEFIKGGEILTLIDPSRCFSRSTNSFTDVPLPSQCTMACDGFVIDVDMWFSPGVERIDTFQFFSPEHERIRGKFIWFDRRNPKLYNTPLSYTFEGPRRSLTLNFAMFTNSVVARVEVVLLNRVVPKRKKQKMLVGADGEDPAHVYGSLEAHENFLRKEIRLFRVDKGTESIEVRPGEQIRLSRSLVIVPSKFSLTVKAKLFDYDPESESVNNVIADGHVDFRPEYYGTYIKKIPGDYGEIAVKVTWVAIDFETDYLDPVDMSIPANDEAMNG